MNFRMDLVQNVKRADNAEKEIGDLSKKIKTLLAEKPKPESEEVPKELLQLRVENTNLKSELENLQFTTAEIKSQKASAKAKKTRLVFLQFFFFNNQTKYDMSGCKYYFITVTKPAQHVLARFQKSRKTLNHRLTVNFAVMLEYMK